MPEIEINIPKRELMDGFVGRRVEIGHSKVPSLRNLRGQQGRVTTWRYNTITPSGVLFFIELDDGRRKCACWYDLRFLLPDLDDVTQDAPTRGATSAEGSRHA